MLTLLFLATPFLFLCAYLLFEQRLVLVDMFYSVRLSIKRAGKGTLYRLGTLPSLVEYELPDPLRLG